MDVRWVRPAGLAFDEEPLMFAGGLLDVGGVRSAVNSPDSC